MDYHFYAPLYYERWDHRTPDDTGIGGSETAVVELAWRLARLGHAVKVYAPIRDDCPPIDKGGAKWFRCEEADFTARGMWVLSRCPADIDRFPDPHPFQKLWLVCQDVAYPATSSWGLTHERAAKLDILIGLCNAHVRYLLGEYPEMNGKIGLSSNGLKVELVEEVEAEGIERDPFKVVFTSSPDRGLADLLKIFKRAREFEPRLKLSAAYGFNNIDKAAADQQLIRLKAECEALVAETGATWLGRMNQRDLYREFLSAGIWCYPTKFTETSCVTCMEAQALGAIPLTAPVWALADNVRHGTWIEGDPKDPLVKANYVAELVALARDADRQAKIRPGMMAWARDKFTWDKIARQYEEYATDVWGCQMDFQIRHGNGRVLNIGSNRDFPRFGQRGGVNLDIQQTDPCGWENVVDVLHDCREPLPFPPESFDSVVIGEVLEHFTDEEAIRTLFNAKNVLAQGGQIVLTVPDDHRTFEEQSGGAEKRMYDGDSPGYHTHRVPLSRIRQWLAAAGLKETKVEPIHYDFTGAPPFDGHGVLACSV